MTINILLLEDSDLDAELIAGHLGRGAIPHRITRVKPNGGRRRPSSVFSSRSSATGSTTPLPSSSPIATQTLRSAESLESFKASFLSRLLSLGKTHDLLTRTNWAGASLKEILAAELEPYRVSSEDRCVLSGPVIELFPNAALTLALTCHELATNAAKYGALSQSNGRLHVTWRADPDGTGEALLIRWTEEGGPPVSQPKRRGFGSRLIEQSMKALGGSAEMEYASKGLRCDIRMPLESSPLDLVVPNGIHVHLSTRSAAEHNGSGNSAPGPSRRGSAPRPPAE